jgi:hypothetical protein
VPALSLSAVLQFYYGEDGIDPTQTGCLKTFPFLFYNSPQVRAVLLVLMLPVLPTHPASLQQQSICSHAVR